MHVIAAEVTAAAGKREELITCCRSMLQPSRAEPGCLSYRFFEDPDQPGRLLFFEEWLDQAAIDFHFATDHFQAFGERIADLLEAAPAITIYSVAATARP
ncbi:MAG: antibiotic biosynthesis monooxygenase [Planctomycetes bacterium]|nr:antibiotic biosynthesis monooxygenase [Planctomycetota bacterium]